MGRHIQQRPVLVAATLLGVAAGMGLRHLDFPLEAALLGGWCATVLAYLLPTVTLMLSASPEALDDRAARLNETDTTVLVLGVLAALASLAAVGWFLSVHGGGDVPWKRQLPLATILLSWAFVQVIFAVRYAEGHARQGAGMRFGSDEPPVFTDFLFAALCIGIGLGADVGTRELRRVAIVHMLISFVFNVVIISAAVNVAADLFSF